MIIGEFEGSRPYVSGYVEIPRLAVRGSVRFLVDTGADVTCIHPKDGASLFIPFEHLQKPKPVNGIGGSSSLYREDVVLSFRESLGSPVYRYRVEVRIAKPEDAAD